MSKSKLHAPQRRRSHKEGTRKSSDRAKIQMTPETNNTLCATRTRLRKEESDKLRGRFNAFEETLSKLQSTIAPSGPRYKSHSIREEDIHRHVNWVNGFKGVLVKRTFLDVGKKKGKAWADQHRALHLGKTFFVILLDRLEKFVEKYHSYASGLSRENFMHECLMAVLKKTFSPGHKQAGETPLICDQAVKAGPTRDRLQKILPNIDFDEQDVKKGRDIVELLEEDDDEDFHLTSERTVAVERDDETKSIVSDQSSSGGSGYNDQLAPPPSFEFDVQSPPPSCHIPQPQLIFPSMTNWSSFPITAEILDKEMLLRENQRLKQELESMRRSVVAKEMHMGLLQTPSYNFGTATMALPIPNVELFAHAQQQNDVPMFDVSTHGNTQQPFSLTPTASQYS